MICGIFSRKIKAPGEESSNFQQNNRNAKKLRKNFAVIIIISLACTRKLYLTIMVLDLVQITSYVYITRCLYIIIE